MLRIRARLLQTIRSFFVDHAYLEVDTPILAPSLIPEAHLEVFRTRFEHPDHVARELYLTPSPEVWIKRLLAEGSGSVFQLGKSFRNGEAVGRLHQPEFTMLEYYTVGAGYLDSIEITETLMEAVLAATGDAAGAYRREAGAPAEHAALAPPFERISVGDAFERFAGTRARFLGELDALHGIARSHGMRTRDTDTYEELFNRLFVHLVEPQLPGDRGIVLYDYPAAVPTLAAEKPGTPWAERWELYLGGIETANCYTEERDPRKVRSFFAAEEARKARALVPHRIDEQYYRVFGENFPDCSGVAMGVDRLLMVLLGEQSIKNVMPFTVLD
ncbi:MAG: EF-P lysine aminoacylase GenX [Spirochaetaceae bacterium]